MEDLSIFFIIIFGILAGFIMNFIIYIFMKNDITKGSDRVRSPSYYIFGIQLKSPQINLSVILVPIINVCLWMAINIIFELKNANFLIICMLILSILIIAICVSIKIKQVSNLLLIMLFILGITIIFFDNSMSKFDHILGFFVGGFLYALIYYLTLLILQTKGNGWPDIKLMAVCGLIVGWQRLLIAFIFGSLIATIVLGVCSLFKKTDLNIPFAPFLIIGTIISLLGGNYILKTYINLFIN